jgi:hypothetical protein
LVDDGNIVFYFSKLEYPLMVVDESAAKEEEEEEEMVEWKV